MSIVSIANSNDASAKTLIGKTLGVILVHKNGEAVVDLNEGFRPFIQYLDDARYFLVNKGRAAEPKDAVASLYVEKGRGRVEVEPGAKNLAPGSYEVEAVFIGELTPEAASKIVAAAFEH